MLSDQSHTRDAVVNRGSWSNEKSGREGVGCIFCGEGHPQKATFESFG